MCNVDYYGIHCELPTKSLGRLCTDGQCKNGGNCSLQTGHCICPNGWTGDYCMTPTEGYVCTSHEHCRMTSSSAGYCDYSTGHCICASSNYYGVNCELPVASYGKVCSNGICQNGGFCNPEHTHCDCPSEWTGNFCEVPTKNFSCITNEDCKVTSSSGGNCKFSTGHCICHNDYYGMMCEVPKSSGVLCSDGDCLNGGVCSMDSNHCLCKEGTSGNFCELYTNGFHCFSHDDCRKTSSSGGYCSFATGNCVCNAGYGGVYCTKK